MLVTDREFQLFYGTSTGALARGTFDVGGGYFKVTNDFLVPTGTGTLISQNIWDYGFPILEPEFNVGQPPTTSLFVDSFTLAWANYAPSPQAVGGGTISATLYSGSVADSSSRVVMNTTTLVFVTPPNRIHVSVAAFMPPQTSPPPHPTFASIDIIAGGTVSVAGYLRCIVHGRFL